MSLLEINDKEKDYVLIDEHLSECYLDYAMSVIVGRALPDVRDGLKPVQRRALYAMNELNLSHRSPYKKSARVVGDAIGKYHPHGDTSLYSTIVRLAQDFSLLYPLVDGQGNFGSIDGDNAAAMRYTEVRLTKFGEEMFRDIDKNTVDFQSNYDETTEEPTVLPTRLPNLLLNGSSGIAVGTSTNIPPHNLTELMNGLIAFIRDPKISLSKLMNYIKGPDFPTSGLIYGKQGIVNAYKNGEGHIKLRSETHIEDISKDRKAIILDSIPYQINKSRLIIQIADLVRNKEIEGIKEIKDESDRNIRVVIILKKGENPDIILNTLFKKTNMQVTFGIRMVAIVNGENKTLTLKDALFEFIKFRKSVLIRGAIYDLERYRSRFHILEGLNRARGMIDKIISLIKKSDSEPDAREKLISKFQFTDIQARAILVMRLHQLSKLEENKIKDEMEDLKVKINTLQKLLSSQEAIDEAIIRDFQNIKDTYKTKRKTQIEENYQEITEEDLIPNDQMIVTITHRGYVKRMSVDNFRKQNRGGTGVKGTTTFEDDWIEKFYTCKNLDTLLFITDMGQLFWLKVYKIPEMSRTAKGRPVVNLLNLRPKEKIKAIIPTSDFNDNKSILFFTKRGLVKRTNLAEYSNIRSNGVGAIVLNDEDELVNAKIVDKKTKYAAIVTYKGQSIKFNLPSVKEQGRLTKGVLGIRFKDKNDYVVDGTTISDNVENLLVVSDRGIGKRTLAKDYRTQMRGGTGSKTMNLNTKTGNLLKIIRLDNPQGEDIMCLSNTGKMIRIDPKDIRILSRTANGSKLIKLGKDETLIDVTKVIKEDMV